MEACELSVHAPPPKMKPTRNVVLWLKPAPTPLRNVPPTPQLRCPPILVSWPVMMRPPVKWTVQIKPKKVPPPMRNYDGIVHLVRRQTRRSRRRCVAWEVNNTVQERHVLWEEWASSPAAALKICRAMADGGAVGSSTCCSVDEI